MRPSLEHIGRFDPERARQRFIDSFRPKYTRKIEIGGSIAGCVALGPGKGGVLLLDHFYIAPDHQRRGLGDAVMRRLLAEVDAARAAVRLSVLRESSANRFYPRYGFIETCREAFEVYYQRPARP